MSRTQKDASASWPAKSRFFHVRPWCGRSVASLAVLFCCAMTNSRLVESTGWTGETSRLRTGPRSTVNQQFVKSSDQNSLRDKLRACQRYYFQQPLNTRDYGAWSTMHTFLGLGVNTPLCLGPPGSQQTNAIGHLCWNRPCRGQRLLYLSGDRMKLRAGPGFQGHDGQLLSMLAQCKVGSDYPMRVQGREFTVADLVEEEKRTCQAGKELTFKLIGLSHYLKSDERWQSDYGEPWDIPRLIRAELHEPINGAACGGTHRLMALTYAVHKRRQRNEAVDGVWLQAEKRTRAYQQLAFRLQNRDGSFSTNWFRARENKNDIPRKLQTTGHVVEWLVFSLPEEQLRDPRLVRSVGFLVDLMTRYRTHKWEMGHRGHALRALRLYDERVFQAAEEQHRIDTRHDLAETAERSLATDVKVTPVEHAQ